MDLNNRRTGKDATKLRALGLLRHSDNTPIQKLSILLFVCWLVNIPHIKQHVTREPLIPLDFKLDTHKCAEDPYCLAGQWVKVIFHFLATGL